MGEEQRGSNLSRDSKIVRRRLFCDGRNLSHNNLIIIRFIKENDHIINVIINDGGVLEMIINILHEI